MDVKYPVSGSIRIWWLPANGLANPKAPTAAEIAAGLDLSDAISWNDKDFGVQASNTTSDPAITATGNTQNRGAAQYGGSLSFYYPQNFDDPTNWYATVWTALHKPGTAGYIVSRVDGLEKAAAAGDASGPGWNAAAGDLVTVYRVETAGYSEQITGEEAFRYTISFLPKGLVAPFVVVRASATAVKPVLTGPATLTVGGHGIVKGTLIGRPYTRGLVLSGSFPGVGTVSRNGVVTAIGAGSLEIKATDPATGEESLPLTIAIS